MSAIGLLALPRYVLDYAVGVATIGLLVVAAVPLYLACEVTPRVFWRKAWKAQQAERERLENLSVARWRKAAMAL